MKSREGFCFFSAALSADEGVLSMFELITKEEINPEFFYLPHLFSSTSTWGQFVGKIYFSNSACIFSTRMRSLSWTIRTLKRVWLWQEMNI